MEGECSQTPLDFSPFLPNPTRFSSFFPLANSTLWLWQTMTPPLHYSKYLFGWPLCLSKCLSRVLPCCSTQFSNTCFSIGLIRWENLLLYAPVPSRTCITGGPVSLFLHPFPPVMGPSFNTLFACIHTFFFLGILQHSWSHVLFTSPSGISLFTISWIRPTTYSDLGQLIIYNMVYLMALYCMTLLGFRCDERNYRIRWDAGMLECLLHRGNM